MKKVTVSASSEYEVIIDNNLLDVDDLLSI